MKNIGIDLGTANTIIYQKGKGIILREPSVVAIDTRTRKVIAVGNDAKLMLGKTPGSISALRPLKDGVIAEFDATAAMLRQFFKKISGNTIFTRPKVIVCIPYGVTEVEKRAVEDVTLEAGAQSVALIEEPVAAAIGSGLHIADARGSMIVDIGGGTTEVAVLSYGGIVLSTSLRTAGGELDESIIHYIKKKYNVLIGDVTAEYLKRKFGCAHPSFESGNVEVRGRNLMTGLPAVLSLTSKELREAMSEKIRIIIDGIKVTLENTPPELSSDIYDSGIVLSGGGALLPGLDLAIAQSTGIKTFIARNAIDCVAIGIGKVIESGQLRDAISFRTR